MRTRGTQRRHLSGYRLHPVPEMRQVRRASSITGALLIEDRVAPDAEHVNLALGVSHRTKCDVRCGRDDDYGAFRIPGLVRNVFFETE